MKRRYVLGIGLTAVACAIIVWLQEPHLVLIAGGDARIPELDPKLALSRLLSLWGEAEGFGKNDALLRPTLVPFVLLDLALERIGFSATSVSHFWPPVIAAIQAFYTMRLFRWFVPESGLASVIFVGLATLLNPLQLLSYHTIFPTSALGIALTPGLILLAAKQIESPSLVVIFEFLGLSVLNVATATNPAVLVVQIVPLFAVVLIQQVRSKDRVGAAVGSLQVLLAFLLPGIPFWLPAIAYSLNNFGSLDASTTTYSDATLIATSAFSGFWPSLRLVGGYLFTNDVGSAPFVPSGPFYNTSPILVIASLTLPLLAVYATYFAIRHRRGAIVGLAACSIALLFLMKGAAPPGGGIFLWLFHRIPGMHFLRDPYSKLSWLLALTYALLAGYALASFERSARLMLRQLIAVAFVGLMVSAFPILSGQLFWSHEKVTIPPRYFDAASWFRGAQPGRIIETPVATNIFDTYDWGYVGAGINRDLIANPLISPAGEFASPANAALDAVFTTVHSELGDAEAAYVLGLFGVRYVLADDSIDSNFFAKAYSARIEDALPNMQVDWREGSLSVYGISDGLLNAPIYTPRLLVAGPRDLREIGLTCRILGSCKGVAVVSRDTAARLPGSGKVSFTNGHPRTVRTTWQHYFIPPLASAVAAAPASMKPDSVDYGNEAASVRANDTLVVYGGAPPASVPLDTQHRLLNFDLCTRAGETVWRDLPIATQSPTMIVRFTYSSTGPMPLFSLFGLTRGSENMSSKYFAPFVIDRRPGTFVRLITLPISGDEAPVLRFAADGGALGGCVTFKDVAVDLGATKQFDVYSKPWSVSPPYFVEHSRILPRVIDELRNGALPQYAPLAGSLSDVAPSWSKAEEVEPLAGALAFAVTGSQDPKHPLGGIFFDTSGGKYDVHAYFDHLLPGARYGVTVHIIRNGPAGAKLTVLSDDGEVLADSPIRAGRIDTAQTVQFTVPLDATGVMLYLYDGTSVFLRDTVSQPLLTIASGGTQIDVQQPSPMPTPRALNVVEETASRYVISVQGAPRRFILAFQATSDPLWALQVPPDWHAKRISMNLFCQGWIISGPPGNYTMHLVYTGDSWIGMSYYTFAIGALALVLLTIALEYRGRGSAL